MCLDLACIHFLLQKKSLISITYIVGSMMMGGGSEVSNCIHFLLQKKGVNEIVQTLSLHHITDGMMSEAYPVIGNSSLWKVVCTYTFRSIPTTNLFYQMLLLIKKQTTHSNICNFAPHIPAQILALICCFEPYISPPHTVWSTALLGL